MNLDRAAAFGFCFSNDVQADFARAFFALLVTQRFEPDKKIDFARAKTDRHVPQIALVNEAEILRTFFWVADVRRDEVICRPVFG